MRRRIPWFVLFGVWCMGLSQGRAQESAQEAAPTSPVALPGEGQLRELFANEPSLQEVYQMAERHIGLHPERVGKWLSKVRKRYWMPEIQGLFRLEDDLAESPAFSFRQDPDRIIERDELDFTAEDDKTIEVRAVWRLPEAIWDRQGHRDAITAQQRILRMKGELLNEVSRVYAERQRHIVEMRINPPASPLVRIEKQIRIDELTAQLDVWTGGGFSGGRGGRP